MWMLGKRQRERWAGRIRERDRQTDSLLTCVNHYWNSLWSLFFPALLRSAQWSEGSPCPLSSLHRRFPSKSLAHLIPFWHMLLRGPKLTH